MARSWLVHDVSPEDLRPADHVYKWGSPLHTHHGLVSQILEAPNPLVDPSADDLLDRIIVLHLSFAEADKAKVHQATLRTFLKDGRKGWQGGLLKRARYGISWTEHLLKLPGTCYPVESDPPAVALRRAQALLRLAELRPYDLASLTSANCEHVIVWCKTGQWRSSQVDATLGLARAAALAAGAAAACRSPGHAGLLPLLGGVLLWKVSQQPHEGLLGDGGGGVPPEFTCASRLAICTAIPAPAEAAAEVHAEAADPVPALPEAGIAAAELPVEPAVEPAVEQQEPAVEPEVDFPSAPPFPILVAPTNFEKLIGNAEAEADDEYMLIRGLHEEEAGYVMVQA